VTKCDKGVDFCPK